MNLGSVRMLFQDVGLAVVLSYKGVATKVRADKLLQRLGLKTENGHSLSLTIPTAPLFRGHEPRLRLEPPGSSCHGATARR